MLIRSLEPVEGDDLMRSLRLSKRKGSSKSFIKDKDLCNGPSKLCQAMDITKTQFDQYDLCKGEELWLEKGDAVACENIVVTTRIGINGAGQESASKLLRFYIKGNEHISVRCKTAEMSVEHL